MYLEERVARVEAFMERFLSEHPEMCPHQWIVEEGSYLNKDGNRVTPIRCRFCNKQRESIIATGDKEINFDFSF